MNATPDRRTLLRSASAIGLVVATTGCASLPSRGRPSPADAIVARIQTPRIPDRDFSVKDFGEVAEGGDISPAITAAIAACETAGGGRILLPVGSFLTGPIRLRSRMNLHLPQGCRLRFVADPDRYLPPVFTRWEGVELMGHHPLIYAFEAHDVAVTGSGVIDGGADPETWWHWSGRYRPLPMEERQTPDRNRLFDMAERGVPPEERVFGAGNRLRPPVFQPYRCRNVLIEDVTIVAAPFWLIHPVLCDQVVIRRVTCLSHGPNNDGADPESCTNVLIEDCVFDTGDDCIAIKAGRNADGRRLARPSEDIVVRRCRMKDGHAGVAIGSELTGGVRRVYVQDCRMDSPNLTRVLVIKTNSYRGGVVEDIHFERITAGVIDKAVLQIWLHYEEGDGGGHTPVVRRVSIANSTVGDTGRVLVMRGMPHSPIRDVRLSGLRVLHERSPSVVVDVEDIALDDVRIAGRPWTRADLAALPGLDSIQCDKWAVCR